MCDFYSTEGAKSKINPLQRKQEQFLQQSSPGHLLNKQPILSRCGESRDSLDYLKTDEPNYNNQNVRYAREFASEEKKDLKKPKIPSKNFLKPPLTIKKSPLQKQGRSNKIQQVLTQSTQHTSPQNQGDLDPI